MMKDFSLVLKGALTPVKVKHHSSITAPADFARLLLDIDNYEGAYLTKQALKLAPLVFVRQGELRHAEWTEIDFEKREWKISQPNAKSTISMPIVAHSWWRNLMAADLAAPSLLCGSEVMARNTNPMGIPASSAETYLIWSAGSPTLLENPVTAASHGLRHPCKHAHA